MKTCNITTPPSLRMMTAEELERVVISSIKERLTKKDILPSLEHRYATRRAANSVANQINNTDLIELHKRLVAVRSEIDFDVPYFINTDAHRTRITLRQ